MSDELVGQVFGIVAIGTILGTLIGVAIRGITRFLKAKISGPLLSQRGEVRDSSCAVGVNGIGGSSEKAVIDEVTRPLASGAEEASAPSHSPDSERPTLETYSVYQRFFHQSKQTLEAATEALGSQEIAAFTVEETVRIPEGIDPRLIPTLQPPSDPWCDLAPLRSAMEAV